MAKSSIAGKRLLIVKKDFNLELVEPIKDGNECIYVDELVEVSDHNLEQYDHILCEYSFSTPGVKELFARMNEIENIARDFLITSGELNKTDDESRQKSEVELKKQNLIDKYMKEYPDFFQKTEPDFYKNRNVSLVIEALDGVDISEVAIFEAAAKYVSIICRTKIKAGKNIMQLGVTLKTGMFEDSFNLTLNGSIKKIPMNNQDQDEIHCYQFNLKDPSEEYVSLMQAMKVQSRKLNELLGVDGDDD
jgi:hypothetical protein